MSSERVNYSNTKFKQKNDVVSEISKIDNAVQPFSGGYFSKGFEKLSKQVLSSLSEDKRLYAVAAESISAQLKMHIKRKIIPEDAGKEIQNVLVQFKKEISNDSFIFDESMRDIYEVIEAYVKEKAKNSYPYFQIARSKEEAISGDLRLWVRDVYDILEIALQGMQRILIDKAEENVKTVMPGFNHMQVSQPTTLGHHLMVYVEMFGRDRERIVDARKRMNKSPFGAGEGFGSIFNVNREVVARNLGFDGAMENSIDAVNDRDFAVEFMSVASNCIMHLSTLSQDMMFWQNPLIDFIQFSQGFTEDSKSSPNRRNAEIIELIRSKSGRVYGSLMNVLNTMKGLNLGFSYDLYEVSEPVFDTYTTLLNCINVMSALIADFSIKYKKNERNISKETFSGTRPCKLVSREN